MKEKILILGVSGLLIGLPTVRGQSIGPATLNATGGSAVIGGNTYDWSVGEMTMVSTFTSPGIIVTQGVLQPANNTNNAVSQPRLASQLQVYPNPASTEVDLSYAAPLTGVLSYRLLDANGKELMSKTVNVDQTNITEQLNVADLAAATYLLEVNVKSDAGNEEKTAFKIQKIK